MKKLISILMVFVGHYSLAGGSGAGGATPPKMMSSITSPEIVFHLGERQGQIDFAYGQALKGQWMIEKHTLPQGQLLQDKAVWKALQDSKFQKSWISIPGQN